MEMVRTTIDLPRDLYIQAKIMSVLVGKPVSHIMRIALAEKIRELKLKNDNMNDSAKK